MLMRNAITNNKSLAKLARKSISVFECSAFSLDVYYSANDPERPPMPPGWSEYAQSGGSNTGYFGRCYIKNFDSSSGPYLVVFAHRGVVLNDAGSIWNGFNVALGNVPNQIEPASRFMMNVEISLTRQFENIDWSNSCGLHTGHSLGGVISDLLSVGSSGLMPTITFENPGSKPIIIQLLRSHGFSENEIKNTLALVGNSCETFLADVNFINTCNEQIGKSSKMINLPWNYGNDLNGPMLPITADYRTNPYYYFYTWQQHQITKIYAYFKNNGEVEIVNYPVGFKQGYCAYLDASLRKDYWDGYLERIWATHANLREEYKEIEKYAPVFYLELKRSRDRALGKINETKFELSGSHLGLFKAPLITTDGLDVDNFVFIESETEQEAPIEASSQRCTIM